MRAIVAKAAAVTAAAGGLAAGFLVPLGLRRGHWPPRSTQHACSDQGDDVSVFPAPGRPESSTAPLERAQRTRPPDRRSSPPPAALPPVRPTALPLRSLHAAVRLPPIRPQTDERLLAELAPRAAWTTAARASRRRVTVSEPRPRARMSACPHSPPWSDRPRAHRVRGLAAPAARAAAADHERDAEAGAAAARRRTGAAARRAYSAAGLRPRPPLRSASDARFALRRSGPARAGARSGSPRSGSRATGARRSAPGTPATEAASSSRWRIARHAPMFCGSSCAQTISSQRAVAAHELGGFVGGERVELLDARDRDVGRSGACLVADDVVVELAGAEDEPARRSSGRSPRRRSPAGTRRRSAPRASSSPRGGAADPSASSR